MLEFLLTSEMDLHDPYVGFWKVFEMPILGYPGYPLFGLIVFSYAALILNFIAKQDLAKLFSSQS